MIFCDTSIVAKFYVSTAETPAVRRLIEAEDEVCVSELMKVELMAVFHRRLREGKYTLAEFSAVVRQFSQDDLGGFWTWLSLDRAILDAAAKTFTLLPKSVFLRSADCMHLATALHHNFSAVHTYDKQQAAACKALGLEAAVP